MRGVIIVALLIFTGFQSAVFAAEPVGPRLTERLRLLLTDEMQQVARATGELAVAIAVGDHASTERLSMAVLDSFILKQSLTAQDKQDFMAAVPPDFISLDGRFHAMAGKLAHAAETQDSELQAFYFAQMLESCVSCHTRFAANRFPGLAEDAATALVH